LGPWQLRVFVRAELSKIWKETAVYKKKKKKKKKWQPVS